MHSVVVYDLDVMIEEVMSFADWRSFEFLSVFYLLCI
jgi:hypothetical protein